VKFLIIVGLVLIVLGVASLIYEGWSYTTERQVADLGVAQITARETETIPIPPWVGVVLVAAGVGAILLAKRSKE
jgi:uncharacterized membrane protein